MSVRIQSQDLLYGKLNLYRLTNQMIVGILIVNILSLFLIGSFCEFSVFKGGFMGKEKHIIEQILKRGDGTARLIAKPILSELRRKCEETAAARGKFRRLGK